MDHGQIKLGMIVKCSDGTIGKVVSISFPAHSTEVTIDVIDFDDKQHTWNENKVSTRLTPLDNGFS